MYQQSLFRVYTKLDKFDTNLDFRKWAFSVCVNQFKNNKRYEKHHGTTSDCDFGDDKDTFLENIADDDMPAEKVDLYLSIHNAVSELPAKLRTVVVLHYFDDFDLNDICSITGYPMHTVKNSLFKARKVLKERLMING